MLRKIPARKSSEEIYQHVNWTFSIVHYIKEPMLRLELRDECVKRYITEDAICKSKAMEKASFRRKFKILVDELMNIKEGMSIEEYLKYYIYTPQGSVKRYYLYRQDNKRTHTMTASIKKVKQIPEGAICQ